MPFYLVAILTLAVFFTLMMTPVMVTSWVCKYHDRIKLANACFKLYHTHEYLITTKLARIIGTVGIAFGVLTMFGGKIQQHYGNTTAIICTTLGLVLMTLLGATAALVMAQVEDMAKRHQGS
jgi:peptidoglycan/LPS O-acetylase OafA/YrhL